MTDISIALRLSKFYGWSLAETLELPVWVIMQAAEAKREIEYEEFARSVVVACSPNMNDAQRRRVIAKMKPQQAKNRTVIEHNPEKAKKFFESIGAKVNG